MKKILLSSLFLWLINFCYSQSGILDSSFGMNGIVKKDMGSPFNYSNIGKQVLVQADGSMYLVIEAAGLIVVTKRYSNGTTDLSYGNNGYSLQIPMYGASAALQSDGKIVIVGGSSDWFIAYGGFYSVITRLNTDGNRDSAFNKNITQMRYISASSVAIQSDGKIVVAGTYTDVDNISNPMQHVILLRYNIDGTLDGMVEPDFGNFDYASSLALDNNGKIVIGGKGLYRYNSNLVLDSTFNGTGYLLKYEYSNAVTIQKDGKIVEAGSVIQRYNDNGTLDSTFDGDGILTTMFGGTNDAVNSMILQNDGKIVVAGFKGTENNKNFAIARYNTDGSPDSSFSNDGKDTTNFNSIDNQANSIAIQTDGKLVLLGYNTIGNITDFAAVRYNTDGGLDNSFDADGILTDNIKQGSTFFTSTAIQRDGKILAAGYTWNGSNCDFALARYNLNGSLDNTFSGDGMQSTDFGSTDDKAWAITVQSDGKIVLGGSAGNNIALARYNTDGNLDNSFSDDGTQATDLGSLSSVSSVVIQSDGKIVAAGSVLVRYNTNGSLDATFDGDGILATSHDYKDLALQKDGKIVVISDYTAFRYTTNGSADSTFGENGEQTLLEFFLGGDFLGRSIAIQNDGKIIIGGYSEYTWKGGTEAHFELGRLNADGTFDANFNGGTVLRTSITPVDYATSVIIQNDNKIILAGYGYVNSGDNFIIIRCNTDGSWDNTFGKDGIQITNASVANDRIAGLAVTGNYLYAVGYGQYPGNLGVVARYLLGPEGGPSATTIISAAEGNWNEPATWIGGIVPYSTSPVIVQHNVTITTNSTCYSLKIEPPAGYLTIATGVNLTITH